MMKLDLVVTRHVGLIQFLKEIGLATNSTKILEHCGPEDVQEKNVCGVLPHSLSCLCETFTEIPLNIPQELRGKELSIEQIREFAGEPVTYMVRTV